MKLLKFLRNHKFEGYLLAFTLILVPPLPMYYAANQANWPVFWFLLAIVVSGNLIALVI